MKEIILASQSPRRRELLSMLNVDFKVVVSGSDEIIRPELSLTERIQDIARQKAMAVLKDYSDALVIGADTIVAIDNQMLGKPVDKDQAREMLMKLSGRTHQVITAMCFASSEETVCYCEVADVTFDEIDHQDMEEYLQTSEAYDKAGAYAIQGWAARYISNLNGSYFTVMGLPVHLVYRYLRTKNYL